MWKVMRSLGLFLGAWGKFRASELDLWPGSSDRMSEGSQRGAACENTLRNLAFIVVAILLLDAVESRTRAKRHERLDKYT